MSNTNLKNQLQNDMKQAMKAKDKKRLDTIRLIIAAIKQKEIDERIELDDTAVLIVLDKMLKQRRDSFEQYKNANRNDLAEQEAFEISLIETYMPAKLSDAELNEIITQAIKASNAESQKDMGKVMGIVKPKVQGRVDMRDVSTKIKDLLS